MASLRDVLNHAGKKVRVTTGAAASREGLAMKRGDLALIEPKLEPKVGDVLEFIETGERFRLDSAEPQEGQGKIDHYRARATALPRG